MRMIMCWKAEDGEYYRDRDMALSKSPKGKLEEIWGESDSLKPCYYVDSNYVKEEHRHVPECRGSGDVENHVFPILRTYSITKLMGHILTCCGDNLSGFRSCGCCHHAMILKEKLEKL